MKNQQSKALYERACKHLPGGVNSPVRAFKSVNTDPIIVARGEGAYIFDEDGNKYLDMISSWGPLILGHANPMIIEKVISALKLGTSFGVTTKIEIELAELIKSFFPSVEKIRFVNSGTEATMSAIRLARGFTGKDKIIKFEGCYHGHADSFLIKAGSGAMTFGAPDSLGVTRGCASDTISVPYNNLGQLVEAIQNNKGQIAAIIIEPVAGNIGVVLPEDNYLKEIETLCRKNSILLIFDEIITGFRVSLGGAQRLYDINPDLTCLGKIIGGGFPVAAYGGRKEIMSMLSPEGAVYQAGTLSGNPLAMSAGFATLKMLSEKSIQDKIRENSENFISGINQVVNKLGLREKLSLNHIASMFTTFFTGSKVTDYKTAKKSDTKLYASFFKEMLNNGVLLAPAQFEACFVSAAQNKQDIEFFLAAFEKSLTAVFKN